ncbi:MAG: hypothetical protein WC244_00210 [Patescibacteria group bacterium]
MKKAMELLQQFFFADILFVAGSKLFRTAIIDMAFLPFGGNAGAALAFHKSSKSIIVFVLPERPSSVFHYRLNFIKKLLGNNWLVLALVDFAIKLEYSAIKGIIQYVRNHADSQDFAALAGQANIAKLIFKKFKRKFSRVVHLKHLYHELGAQRINEHGFSCSVVKIADGRFIGIFAAP